MPRGKRADTRPEIIEAQNPLIDVAKEPVSAPEPLPIRDAAPDGSDRIGIKLIDGKFDKDSFRAKTAEKFQNAIKLAIVDPEFRSWAGLEGVPASVIEESFKPEHFGMVLDTVVMIETTVMAGKTGLTSPEVEQYLKWSPEEHGAIDTIGARVLGRYLPGEWLKYTDLILLIMTFVSITMKKISALNVYAKEKLEAIGRARSPEPVSVQGEQKAA